MACAYGVGTRRGSFCRLATRRRGGVVVAARLARQADRTQDAPQRRLPRQRRRCHFAIGWHAALCASSAVIPVADVDRCSYDRAAAAALRLHNTSNDVAGFGLSRLAGLLWLCSELGQRRVEVPGQQRRRRLWLATTCVQHAALQIRGVCGKPERRPADCKNRPS